LPHIKAARVLVTLEVRLRRVLDLTGLEVQERLGLNSEEMRGVLWRVDQAGWHEALTQAVGRAAFGLGLEAIIVPSAPQVGGKNLVIFPTNRAGEGSWSVATREAMFTNTQDRRK
jgi:RES domain-containing protein